MTSKREKLFGDQAAGIELLWGAHAQPRRGPKPALSLERIVRTAIDLADAEGLAAVSMQRLADELGFTKMAMYRYVPGKSELVALMVDHASGSPPDLASVPGDWRPKLREWGLRLFGVLHAHPWVIAATTGLRVLGPNELGWAETALASLAGTRLDGAEQLDTIGVITGHVRNLAQQTAGTPHATWGLTERQYTAAMAELLHDHPGDFPALAAVLASAAGSQKREQLLEYGLDRILDGIEAHLAGQD
ncbi:TetR/AcrR family transcriptional regulator [Flindersiella endophytica]